MKLIPSLLETTPALEETALIKSVQQGDHQAFRDLYQSHRDAIYSFLYYTLKDQHLAEDVLQTVFLKIYRHLPEYRFECRFRTWACRIALNEARNHVRSRRQHHPLAMIVGTSREKDSAPDPHAQHLLEQRQQVVQRALLELPADQRTAIVLKYVEGLSYAEIANVMKCSQGTVASRLNRALVKLESLLAPFRGLI